MKADLADKQRLRYRKFMEVGREVSQVIMPLVDRDYSELQAQVVELITLHKAMGGFSQPYRLLCGHDVYGRMLRQKLATYLRSTYNMKLECIQEFQNDVPAYFLVIG